MRNFVLVLLIGFIPLASQAAVTINEIAWMGNSTSANYEWIELYNDGGNVNLNGWSLSDGGSVNIPLDGTLTTNSFAVLERTSDASAPGTAFIIYTGALNNSGTTRTLRRDDGGVEDQVSGGEDWENLGGDNITKATAQYTTGGWITADPTPGYANTNQPQPVETAGNSVSSAKRAIPVERESQTLELPGVTLELDLEAPNQGFVNQSISFDLISDGVGSTIANSLNYSWNFGDTNVSEQKSPTHTFEYPGTYVVYASAEYARQQAFVTKEITILPVAASLTKNSQGDIQINNDSPYAIDLSKYRLRAGQALEIPKNTWLLSRQTITIPRVEIGATNDVLVALYDSHGGLVASVLPAVLRAEAQEEIPVRNGIVSNTVKKVIDNSDSTAFQFASEKRESEEVIDYQSGTTDKPVILTETKPAPVNSTNWPIVALVVLLSVSCIVVLMQPLMKTDSLDKHE